MPTQLKCLLKAQVFFGPFSFDAGVSRKTARKVESRFNLGGKQI
jgi:hypothetical protein